MNLDPAVWVALIGLAGGIAAHWIGRRKRAADAQDVAARAARVVQDTYQEVIDDLRATARAAREEALSAKASAREAQSQADEAAHEAWKAEQQVAAMARFLTELRPLIATHVPGAEPFLERLDRLTAPRRLPSV